MKKKTETMKTETKKTETKIPAHLYYKKIDTSVFPEKVTYYSVIDHRELTIEDIIGFQKEEAEEK